MKKLINSPLAVVEEMVEGLLLSDGRLTRVEGETVILRRDRDARHVALISGGGSGHEPAHGGYVGRGMLAAAVAGQVFTSPSVDAVLAAIRAVASPAGVLLIVKNYTGDRLNFGLAAEIARSEGIAVETVIVADDVALDDEGSSVGRRGIAGTVFVHKIAGAAAVEGLPLADVKRAAEAACECLFSMGLGLSACTVPAAGQSGFDLGPDEVEYGLGIHGEAGARRGQLAAADAMLDTLIDRIIERGGLAAGDRIALMVNNLGGTAIQELPIIARQALLRLRATGISVEAVLCGTFLTALEMAGCSLSAMRIDDERLSRLLAATDAPAWAPVTIPGNADAQIEACRPVTDQSLDGPEWSEELSHVLAATIRTACEALLANEAELTRLDSIVGDGDIGISLARGARAVLETLPSLPLDRPSVALHRLSMLLRQVLGGTSGPLYAMFLLRMANSLAKEGEAHDLGAWARAFRAGSEGGAELGGARAGERTMLDALLPAAAALEGAIGKSGTRAVALMHAAAEKGAFATRDMLPRRGRSSYLGQRVLGHVDPGAWAVSLLFGAFAGGDKMASEREI